MPHLAHYCSLVAMVFVQCETLPRCFAHPLKPCRKPSKSSSATLCSLWSNMSARQSIPWQARRRASADAGRGASGGAHDRLRIKEEALVRWFGLRGRWL